jgi:hypothetical protein
MTFNIKTDDKSKAIRALLTAISTLEPTYAMNTNHTEKINLCGYKMIVYEC